ncbi:MAG: helix-turn-helix domain-containing protein [Hyphomicrobiales bacterium]|nr:helix-turn-helix domain-containing protein [Hyphomicrobiales bacterium]
MSAQSLAPRRRARRDRIFAGFEKPVTLDRNMRTRILTRAHALSRRTKKGKHYGAITAKDVNVLRALLFDFLNWKDGRCFPSYETIASAADCCRSHVATAIKRLEAAGLLTWVNRLKWVRERCRDLFGRDGVQKRALRTSNAYRFFDPGETLVIKFVPKSKFTTRTANQDSYLHKTRPTQSHTNPDTALNAALLRFEEAFRRKKDGGRA